MATTAAVELSGVSKHFDDIVAVEDLTLSIADGEFFSLLGPSGCGKTTTLRMIAGFEFPTNGSLKIHGEEMGLLPPNKRPVNTVFQSYALFPHMSIAENVGFGLQMLKVNGSEIETRVKRALDMVQLAHRADARPKQLSGGQRQRIALARALVNEPQVLLLDEPLGALDLKLRQSMQIELKELQSRVGITFIYVTHDQQEALTMSDRIGVMNDGQLLQVDDPQGLYEQPKSRFVADFIGEINLIDASVVDSDKVKLAGGTTVEVATGKASGSAVVVAIRPERLGLHSVNGNLPTERNLVEGTVARRIYHGDFFFYDVDTSAGRLEVKEENRPSIERFDEGTKVFVSWNPTAATVVEG
ncbi:MAG: ABC transporter ATP-binding protein [Acidimicrobiia bacterium]|nr:ABC transporter ATP-binding protein [Acidimicrobiia bacterium]